MCWASFRIDTLLLLRFYYALGPVPAQAYAAVKTVGIGLVVVFHALQIRRPDVLVDTNPAQKQAEVHPRNCVLEDILSSTLSSLSPPDTRDAHLPWPPRVSCNG